MMDGNVETVVCKTLQRLINVLSVRLANVVMPHVAVIRYQNVTIYLLKYMLYTLCFDA